MSAVFGPRLASLALVVLAAGASAQEDSEGLPEPGRHPILSRSPSEWPRTGAERWKGWAPGAEPPAEVREPVAAVGRAYAAGDLPGALEAIFRLFEIEPDYPPALHQAGVVYFKLRRYSDSIQAFERYLAVAPERVADTRALGHGYYTLGQYERAKAHYERVLACEPESVETLRGYALAHMRLGDAKRALELLAKVVELDPTHANAHAWTAQILFDEERVEEAAEAVARARELDPYEARGWFLTSQILFDLGRDEEAEAARARFELLNRVAQEARGHEARLLYEPRQPELLARLTELHRTTGNLPEVRRALLRWLMLAPDDVPLRIHVLDVLTEMGDRRGAAAAAEALEVVGAEDVDAWRRLVLHYAQTRERMRQVRAEEQVARLRARDDGDG